MDLLKDTLKDTLKGVLYLYHYVFCTVLYGLTVGERLGVVLPPTYQAPPNSVLMGIYKLLNINQIHCKD